MKLERLINGEYEASGIVDGLVTRTTGRTRSIATKKFMALLQNLPEAKGPSHSKKAVRQRKSLGYSQIDHRQRSELARLYKLGFPQSIIAFRLNISQSTVSRELSKNSVGNKYTAKVAQKLRDERNESAGLKRRTAKIIARKMAAFPTEEALKEMADGSDAGSERTEQELG